MAKARVHELAKELGVTSKEVLARLSEQGEFVKSASSTVEAPVARRLRESFGGGKAAPKAEEPAAKAPAKSAAPAPAKTAPAPAADGQAVKAEATAAPAAKPSAPTAPAAAAPAPAAPPPAPAQPGPPPPAPGRGPGAGGTGPQARRPGTARRQQPVLLGAAGGAGHPASASAGAPAGRTPAGHAASRWRLTGQHAGPPQRLRRPRPSSAARRTPARRWRPSGCPRRPSGRSRRRCRR